MRSHEVENWALAVIGRIGAGGPTEDSRVELKREWPDPVRAARRLAGHANAAHGEPILWLIGVDEEEGVVGAAAEELANWYAEVKAQFEGLGVRIASDLNVPVANRTVVALLFDTDRAPYLVKNPAYGQPNGGPVQLEVPWREGRSTRTTSRSDLLQLLSPLQKNPSFELLGAWLKVYPELGPPSASGGRTYSDDPSRYTWKLNMDFYVSPRTDARVVIPFHHCTAASKLPGCEDETHLGTVVLEPLTSLTYRRGKHIWTTDSATIESTKYEALITGPGRLVLRAEVDLPKTDLDYETAEVKIHLGPVDADHPIAFRETLHQAPPDTREHELACWSRNGGRENAHGKS